METAQIKYSGDKGFTLVELLIVIAIIAILAAIIALIINPLELIRRGRDTTRLSDLSTLSSAINVAVKEATTSGGSSNILCAGQTPPCQGESDVDSRAVNGGGWVKVDLSAQKTLSVPTLPVDPINTTPNVYKYATDNTGNFWEINAVLESQKFTPMMASDGGDNDQVYEIGSKLTILH